MRRPHTLPGLLLAVAKLQLARPPVRRALAVTALGLAAVTGFAALRTPAPPAAHHTPLVALERAPAYPAGVCTHSASACSADEGCGQGERCVYPFRVAVPIPPGEILANASQTWSPSVAYDGAGGYAVAWVALHGLHTEVFFARVGASGERQGTPLRVTDSSDVKVVPHLVAGRGGYGAAWTAEHGEHLSVYFASLGPDGKARATPVALGGTDGYRFFARAAWNGSEYGVAYYHFDPPASLTIEFARVSSEGRVVGAPRVVARNVVPTSGLELAWSGGEYALAWNDFAPTADATDVKLLRLSPAGEPGKVLSLARREGLNGALALAAAGDRAAVVFADESLREPTNRLWFASARGGRVDSAARALTDGTGTVGDPGLTFAADWLGAVYTDTRDGRDEVYFQRLDPGGESAGSAVRITEAAHGSRAASLAFALSEYGLAWQSGTLANSGIYFTRLSATGERLGREVKLSE